MFAGSVSLGALTSQFSGLSLSRAPRATTVAAPMARASVTVHASQVCDLTGKKRNKANTVSFSGKRNRKWQGANIQEKRIYWPEGQRLVRLKVSTKALRTLEKKGLNVMAKEAGIDLWSLPYVDCSEARLQYKRENPMKVPMAANPRAIKNPEKIAASKKKPIMARYELGRIVYYREGEQ